MRAGPPANFTASTVQLFTLASLVFENKRVMPRRGAHGGNVLCPCALSLVKWPAVLQHPLELLAAPCARAIILAASFSASTAQLSTQASLVLNDGRDMARCAARALYHLAARCGFSCGVVASTVFTWE